MNPRTLWAIVLGLLTLAGCGGGTSAPSAPLNVGASPGNGQATVSWVAPASPGASAIASYTVTPYTGGNAQSNLAVTVEAGSTTGKVLGLTNGTSYSFTVFATNAQGNSPESAPSNAVTPNGFGFTGNLSTFTASPSTVPADGRSTSTLTLTLKTSTGSAIPGQTVTFSASGTGNILTPSSGVTDSSGVLTATLASTVAESKTVIATSGTGTFTATVTFAGGGFCTGTPLYGNELPEVFTGGNPNFVTTGDLNHDGLADLVAVQTLPDGVSVALGKGNGLFSPSVFLSLGAVGGSPTSVTIADVDQDGRPDLVVTTAGTSNNLVILLGNGDGTFQSPLVYSAHGDPSAVTVADLNGDRVPDLAVANRTTNDVSVFEAVMAGVFPTTPTMNVSLGTSSGPVAIVSGNLTASGHVDLATANTGSADVTFLINDGTGKFSLSSSSLNLAGVTDMAAADFDHDGKLDLAVLGPDGMGASGIYVLLQGKGSVHTQLSSVGAGLAVGKFNSDDYPDLAVAFPSTNGVEILTGSSTGGFNAPAQVTFLNAGGALAAADFNRDGKLDVAAVSTGDTWLTVLPGNGDGTLAGPAKVPTGSQPLSIAAADFNNDAALDLAVANGADNNVSVMTNSGKGLFTIQKVPTSNSYPIAQQVAAADVDQDGKVDLLVLNGNSNTFGAIRNLGAGFGIDVDTSTGANGKAVAFAVADVNGDKAPDVVMADNAGNAYVFLDKMDWSTPYVAASGGPYALGAAATAFAGPAPFAIAIGDVNGDQHPDVVIANQGADTITVLLGNGDGTFKPGTTVSLIPGTAVTAIVLGDFNKDQKLDIATANAGANDVTVRLGNGDGTFAAPTVAGIADALFGPVALAAVDLNGDSKLDLVAVDGTSNEATVILGNGDGSFRPTLYFPTQVAPNALVAADLNGDRAPDLAVVNQTSLDVALLFQSGCL